MSIRKISLRQGFLLFSVFSITGLAIFFGYSKSGSSDLASQLPAGGPSVGILTYATDTTISGCAYDATNPSAKIQVHVYSEANLNPVIGLASYGCPWSTDSHYQGHGFQIQYRRPLDSSSGVKVAFLSADRSKVTWVEASQAQHQVNSFDRSKQTFLYTTPNYTIGFSRKYGAAVAEFYNNRVDSTMNLVTDDPGAMIQAALFGADTSSAFSGNNCVGNTDDRYNPTQSGSACPDGSGADLSSSITNCTSSNNNALCNQLKINQSPNDANPDWIQYLVHFRNFYNPPSTKNYTPYEDVYGYVKYTFKAAYVQVDYQTWKTAGTTYGASFQQLPVAFLNQITRFTTDSFSMERAASDSTDIAVSKAYNIGENSGRWVLAESIDNRPGVPISSAGNFLTVAFYSAIVTNGTSVCPARKFQGDFLGAPSASDTAWMSVEHSSVFQNAIQDTTMQMNSYYQARAILSPFKPTDNVAGGALSQVVDRLESSGGSMPSWECNQGTIASTPPVVRPPAKPVPPPVVVTPPVRPPAPPPAVTNPLSYFTVNVYRFRNDKSHEHFFTLSEAEGRGAGMTEEGVGFSVSPSAQPGMVAVYRCYIPNFKHFVSLDAKCEGQRTEGAYGYIYSTQVNGTSPLYRMYISKLQDHFVTKNSGESPSSVVSILGYVP